MAEGKLEGRDVTWRHLLPWTELFRGFQVALDLNKLLLAAAGILVMWFGWWLLAVIFAAKYPATPPSWPERYRTLYPDNPEEAWKEFRRDRDEWNLMYETAGIGSWGQAYDALDLASTEQEYDAIKAALAANDNDPIKAIDSLTQSRPPQLTAQQAAEAIAALKDAKEKDPTKALNSLTQGPSPKLTAQQAAAAVAALKAHDNDPAKAVDSLTQSKAPRLTEQQARAYKAKLGKYKRYASMSLSPWKEDRGPNPYLLVTGQAGIPWEAGRFWDWFVRDQLLVMIEPLVKFVQPIIYFFSPRSTGYTSFYFLCVMLWTLATWALFGGAITRIAAVQITRGEKIGLREALRFTAKRILSYLMAPLFPLAFVFVILIFMILFGFVHLIPGFSDFVWDGLLWWLMLICGLVMAVTLVGLVGWPLMSATISTEGTDSWEAVSRSYSYVYQKPWHYIWYGLVAIAYGAVLVFFVGFMGSLTVYLAKWGVSQTPGSTKLNRDPSYLFVYAPSSFGWRTLLLSDATVHGLKLVDNGELNEDAYADYLDRPRPDGTTYPWKDEKTKDREVLHGWNKVGAFLVAIWLGIVFLLMLGFGYSYFWSASTIIYLLMRRHVDAAELDEVYLEEDEQEGPYGHFTPPPPPTAVKPPSMTMVEAPTLRTPSAPPAPPPPPPPTPLATATPPESAAPTPVPIAPTPALEPSKPLEPPPALPPSERNGGDGDRGTP